MLIRRNGVYHFRRVVPPELRARFKKTEIWSSLGTSDRRIAKARAGLMYAETEKRFSMAKPQPSIRDESWFEDAFEAWKQTLDEDGRFSDISDDGLREFFANGEFPAIQSNAPEAKKETTEEKLDRILKYFENQNTQNHDKPKSVPDQQPKASRKPIKKSPLFKELTDEFIASKIEYSEQTKLQTRATFKVWGELMGNAPVADITRRDGQEFQKWLRKIPANHGKARNNVSLRKILDQIEGRDIRRITEKTVKRHISTMSQYWLFLKRNGYVTENVFDDFEFINKRSTKAIRLDWSNDDLKTLISSTWKSNRVDVETARWLVWCAMFSGMRLEEICRLRVEDIETHDKIDFFHVREQPDGWTPKTQAGERLIPIHSQLVALGLMKHIKKQRDQQAVRLFDRLRPSGPDKDLSAEFSREFSKFKTSLGFDKRIVFHSFRHNASTILRNAEADIRSEWIDAVLGHESTSKSQGATTYFKRVDPKNLKSTIEKLRYSKDLEIEKLFLTKSI